MSSQDASTSGNSISSKPWFLTFDSKNKIVFIWKNNIRLKVDGENADGVTEAYRLDENHIMV